MRACVATINHAGLAARAVRWACLPAILAMMAACGGGGGSDGGGDPAPAARDRIEPFDPGTGTKAAALPAGTLALVEQGAVPASRTVTLPPLPANTAARKSAVARLPGQPLQIGQPRDVVETASIEATAALWEWQTSARGTQVAALRFVAQEARGMRLGVRVQALPEGAVLRTRSASGEAVEITARELQAMARRNAEGGARDAEAHTWWSPDFGGSETTLEVEIPASANPAAVRIAIPHLSHFTISPAEADSTAVPLGNTASALKAGKPAACHQDASCHPEYLEQSRSVARMVYVENGSAFLCTGTLMNDVQSSGTPYFLSANHCISTQVAASSLNTDWFYRTAACGVPDKNPASRRLTGGAMLLYAAAATDVVLLRLNDAPPAGAVYAGSYFGTPPAPGVSLVGIHHPGGELQKISIGTLQDYASCDDKVECRSTSTDKAAYLRLSWQQGVTEAGSSGSASFVTLQDKRYVVGQLYGGESSCDQPGEPDAYGRFDISYRNALHKWLNP